MSRTTVASPTPLGAGRIRDLTFPDIQTAGAGATNTGLRVRGDGLAPLLGTIVSLGGTTTGWTFFVPQAGTGVDGMSLNNGGAAGAGVCVHWLNVCNVNIRTSRPAFWPIDDDWNVHRIVFIGAAAVSTGGNADLGFQLINSNVSGAGIQRTPAPGFGLQYTTTGFAFRTNNGGGVVDTPLLVDGVGGYRCLDLHSYDLRIFQATPTQDATIKLLVDNVLVLTTSWATNPNLPVPAGGNVGFQPALWVNTAAQGMIVKYLGFYAANTEAFTL